jgi:hypothetical protein
VKSAPKIAAALVAGGVTAIVLFFIGVLSVDSLIPRGEQSRYEAQFFAMVWGGAAAVTALVLWRLFRKSA